MPNNTIAIFIKKILAATITGLRPLLGPATCRFAVGCTQYAIEQLKDKPLIAAIWAITKRLLSCNPLYGVFKKNSH